MNKRKFKKKFHTIPKNRRPVAMGKKRVKLIKILLDNNVDVRILNTFTALKRRFHGKSLDLAIKDKHVVKLILSGADMAHINLSLFNHGIVRRPNKMPTDGTGKRVRIRK